MNRIEALRCAVGEEPSQPAWDEVERLLDEATDAELTLWLAYVREHARDWPPLRRLTRWRRFVSLPGDDPRWSLVDGLDLQRARIVSDDVDRILRAPAFSKLHALNLYESDTEPADIWRLLEVAPAGLDTLILSHNPLGDQTAQYIPEWLRLTDLRVQACGLSGFGVAALCANPALTGLTDLYLGDNEIGPEGAAALCGCPLLTGLRVLDLRGAGLTRSAADLLTWSPFLRGVRLLDVRRNPMGADGLAALRAGPAFRDAEIIHD